MGRQRTNFPVRVDGAIARAFVVRYLKRNPEKAYVMAEMLDYERVEFVMELSFNPKCKHEAIAPKGTMLYNGYVHPQEDLWRCNACDGIFRGKLAEPSTPGSQKLTNVARQDQAEVLPLKESSHGRG